MICLEKKFKELVVDSDMLMMKCDANIKHCELHDYDNFDKDFPIGIYLYDDIGNYRLIDGRHRYLSYIHGKKNKKVKIIAAM